MRGWASEIGRLLRLGLPALAVYALVLQAFLAGAAPAAAFDPSGAPLCAERAAGSGQPTQPIGHDHDSLCLTHCTAPASPAFVGAAALVVPPVRMALLARHAPGDDADAHVSTHRGPGARAPPQA